jgi:hypothetical protein
MARTTNRETALPAGTSVDQRLARLLDTSSLARVVPHLAPETLHQLIGYRGLDACGELLTSATPAQLTSLLDLDLWRHAQPGHDERFDVDRFGEWLEVLVDAGESLAARTVAALDTDLVVAGLSRYVRVLDPGIFEPTAQSDDEAIDRHDAMREGDCRSRMRDPNDDGLECEVGGYLVRARRPDAWDAIITLLGALETGQHQYFHAVMQGCRRLSSSRPEIDGLDDLLMAPEQHLHDVAIEREQRRAQQGYATPADARAFLQMARHPRHAPDVAASLTNPIATAYFRATAAEEDTTNEGSADAPPPASHRDAHGVSARDNDGIPASVEAVVALLAEAGRLRHGHGAQGVTPERPRALLHTADEDPSAVLRAGPRGATLPLLRRLMEFARHHDETAYLARSRELAFLANTLLVGGSVQSRSFTPQEASDAAACISNLGLECCGRPEVPEAFLVDHNLVTVFEVGWSVLHEDVSLFVADQLMSTLIGLRCPDADIARELGALQRQLAVQRQAGTPWLSRDAADVLATFDTTAWISVLGLLDECPILPDALTAVLERRTTPVSPIAFEFISTTAQIGDVRVFMKALPEVLSR